MIKDLVQISRLGESKRAENERFRVHLKRHGFVERRFRAIAEDIESQMDCKECGQCCRQSTVRMKDRDVQKMARFMGIPAKKFLEQYCQETEDEGVILKRDDKTGCVFLSGNLCTVYEARPGNCEDFPHTIRGSGSIESRMWDFKDRATYCPIVYNTLEEWKKDSAFRANATVKV